MLVLFIWIVFIGLLFVTVYITFSLKTEYRKTVEHRVSDSRTQNLFVYYDGENVSGAVNINLKPGGKLEHKGVKIELIGQIG